MKISYVNDVHVEFGPPNWHPTPGNILVLAGDIDISARCKWINDQAQDFDHVLYVMGNHEYYGAAINLRPNEIRANLAANVHLLDNSSFEYNGVRFHGSTLWTSFNNKNMAAMGYAGNCMPEFRGQTKLMGDIKFTPEASTELHKQSVQFLQQAIQPGDIVITHHAPSLKSIHKRFEGNPLSAAFATNLEQLILDTKPVLWYHGHMHDSFDYHVGSCRVLCNPRGYSPHELNKGFDPKAQVESKDGTAGTIQA